MLQYRDKVRNLLEALSYITAEADPNGVDLWFTTKTSKQKPKTTADMLRAFSRVSPENYSDMKHRFSHIIEEYYKGFGKSHRLKSLIDVTQPEKGRRKLSLYVLTDGVWQDPCDLKPIIRLLVKKMKQHDLSEDHVVIQFIRFGNDEREKGRLHELDTELAQEDGMFDIVDTTDYDGNVVKMLIGALNDAFDKLDEGAASTSK